MRNKFITLLLSSTVFLSMGLQAQAIDKKYQTGYDLLPASINTAAKENNISFYRNNQIILLKPDPKGKNNKPVAFTATIKENGDIGKPKISKELSELGLAGTVAFDSVGGKLYFSKYNSLEKDYALYESSVVKGKWGDPKKMLIEGTGGQRNKASFMLSAGWSYKPTGLTGFKNPALAKNGKRLYFTANIKAKEYGNVGSTDIWFIDQKADGTWGKPQNLGKNINTTTKEDYAFCVGDTTLYFTSMGKGGMDIFRSSFVKGQWTKAVGLDKPINSGMNDFNLIGNDKNIFLVSNRNPKGKDDIFLFRKQPDKPIIPDPIAIQPESEPEMKSVIIPEWNFVLFYFDFDKDVLKPEFLEQFKELVTEMKQFPGATFEVAGHTDQKGSEKYNMRLSLNRANFVKQMLIKEGFPAANIVTKGFGESMPVIENPKTEDDYAQNRRCEISIVGQEKPKTPDAGVTPTETSPSESKPIQAPAVAPKTDKKPTTEVKATTTDKKQTIPVDTKTTGSNAKTTTQVGSKPVMDVKTFVTDKKQTTTVDTKTTVNTKPATQVVSKPVTDTKTVVTDKKQTTTVDTKTTVNTKPATQVGTKPATDTKTVVTDKKQTTTVDAKTTVNTKTPTQVGSKPATDAKAAVTDKKQTVPVDTKANVSKTKAAMKTDSINAKDVKNTVTDKKQDVLPVENKNK